MAPAKKRGRPKKEKVKKPSPGKALNKRRGRPKKKKKKTLVGNLFEVNKLKIKGLGTTGGTLELNSRYQEHQESYHRALNLSNIEQDEGSAGYRKLREEETRLFEV